MIVEAPHALPTDENFGRNLIGGEWRFPAAPYEFEIRNPIDSTITTEVPLSSRLDVAHAITAAERALSGPWTDPEARRQLLAGLLDRIAELQAELADLQCAETGLAFSDSTAALDASIGLARRRLESTAGRTGHGAVSGHILGWGLPFTEMLLGVFAGLADGCTAVVKPSLRGALSPDAFAYLATEAGLPAGVVNIVQGTGVDVGAALISSDRLGRLSVHGNENTLARAARAFPFTGVPLSTLRGGGNAVLVYPDVSDRDIESLAVQTAAGVRMNSAGALFGIHSIAVHSVVAERVRDAVTAEVRKVHPAPLPVELQRRRTMSRLHRLNAAGGHVLCGGSVPDDIVHRMGWVVSPTVIDLGSAERASNLLDAVGDPMGPVLTLTEWATNSELDKLFSHPRHRDGYGSVWGDDTRHEPMLFGLLVRGRGPLSAARDGLVPRAWYGDGADVAR